MLQILQDDIFDAACERTVIVGLKADSIEIVTPTSLMFLTVLLVTKGRSVDYAKHAQLWRCMSSLQETCGFKNAHLLYHLDDKVMFDKVLLRLRLNGASEAWCLIGQQSVCLCL